MHEKVFEFAVMKVMKGEELNAKESNKVLAKLGKAYAVPADVTSDNSFEEFAEDSKLDHLVPAS